MKVCRSCGQKLSKAFLLRKKKLKAARISNSLAIARKEGRPVGRPIEFDRFEIIRLRNDGMSIRNIAKKIGSSAYVVQAVVTKSAVRESSMMSLTKELLDRWEKQLLSAVRADMDAKDVLELIGLARAGLAYESRIRALEIELVKFAVSIKTIRDQTELERNPRFYESEKPLPYAAALGLIFIETNRIIDACPLAKSLMETQK